MAVRPITEEDLFHVIIDTREKQPWVFNQDKFCTGSTSKKLDTGDYSIVGYTDKIVIERKKSTAEVSINIYEERFEKELIRLENYEFSYLVCEFQWQDILMFPVNSKIPQKHWYKLQVRAEHLEKAFTRYALKYKTKIIFAGKFGQKATYDLFKYFKRLQHGKL